MKRFTLTLVCIYAGLLFCNSQAVPDKIGAQEKIIKAYFAGWEKKDWSIVSSQLADGFTFTSAAPDDHISLEKFREKCWVQAEYIERFDFPEIISNTFSTLVIQRHAFSDLIMKNVIRLR